MALFWMLPVPHLQKISRLQNASAEDGRLAVSTRTVKVKVLQFRVTPSKIWHTKHGELEKMSPVRTFFLISMCKLRDVLDEATTTTCLETCVTHDVDASTYYDWLKYIPMYFQGCTKQHYLFSSWGEYIILEDTCWYPGCFNQYEFRYCWDKKCTLWPCKQQKQYDFQDASNATCLNHWQCGYQSRGILRCWYING